MAAWIEKLRRTERLFAIIQTLRAAQRPVTGRALAEELEVSLRTLYRDMAELIAQRVPIRGEAGTGYVLGEGYDLPPLMFTADELEAAVLGAEWVMRNGDASLARGARDLVAKLTAVIPEASRPVLLDAGLRSLEQPQLRDAFDMADLRRALRDRHKVTIEYADVDGALSLRTVWPFLIAYTNGVRVVAAWCELRAAFRHFRTDRIARLGVLPEGIPRRRDLLLSEWERTAKRPMRKPGSPD
jgi:predicted DNA-binding transcriptional regulator YafY